MVPGSEILAVDETTAAAIISTTGALIGVFIGGLVTTVIEDVRQRRREDRLERAASRLLSDELSESRNAFRRIADQQVVRRESMPSLVPSWEQYRELLATRMEEASWREVATAVLTARRVGGELEPFTASEVGAAQLPAPLIKKIEEASIVTDSAATLLAQLHSS